MINLSKIVIHRNEGLSAPWISMCGKLEACIGNYFLSGLTPESRVEALYHDASIGKDESMELIPRNIAAYYIDEEKIGFVKSAVSEKLKKETEEYGITYITVDDLDQEVLCVDIDDIPGYLNDILWIDDDFMSDDTLPFDSDAFEVIDSKTSYLNPKHFSVSQMIHVLKDKSEIHLW